MKPRYERLPAPFSLRCGAFLIDYIVLVLIVASSALIAQMLGGARTTGSSPEAMGLVIAIVAAALNLGVLPGLTGRTAGKWATGLRIERTDGAPVGIGRAFLRHFVGYPLSLATLGIGFLVTVFTARGRALHDLIADTVVIREGFLIPRRH